MRHQWKVAHGPVARQTRGIQLQTLRYAGSAGWKKGVASCCATRHDTRYSLNSGDDVGSSGRVRVEKLGQSRKRSTGKRCMRCWAAPPRGAPPPLRGSQPCPAFYESERLTVCAACNSFQDWVHHTVRTQKPFTSSASVPLRRLLTSSGSYSQQLASTRHGSTLHTRVVQISRSCCRDSCAIRRRQSRRGAMISVSAGACCGERNRGVAGAARTRTRGHGTSVCRRRRVASSKRDRNETFQHHT